MVIRLPQSATQSGIQTTEDGGATVSCKGRHSTTPPTETCMGCIVRFCLGDLRAVVMLNDGRAV